MYWFFLLLHQTSVQAGESSFHKLARGLTLSLNLYVVAMETSSLQRIAVTGHAPEIAPYCPWTLTQPELWMEGIALMQAIRENRSQAEDGEGWFDCSWGAQSQGMKEKATSSIIQCQGSSLHWGPRARAASLVLNYYNECLRTHSFRCYLCIYIHFIPHQI